MNKILYAFKKLLPLLLLTVYLSATAQEMKFGNYSAAEIALTQCEFEPEAGAVVLGEIGRSYFIIPLLHTNKHIRLKILDNKSAEKGDVVIRYYAGDNQQEMIVDLKAQTMNMVDGKQVITKLSKKDFYEVDAGNGYKEIRFTFPKVEAGAILEYEYKIISKNLTFLDGWVFPNDIPTRFSTYSIDIPEGLDYKMFGQGIRFAEVNANRPPNKAEWTLTALKSIKPEPYMNNFIDHVDKVEFQLAGYIPANTGGYTGPKGYQTVLTNWQALSDDLFAIDRFKSYFRNNSLTKSLQDIPLAGESPIEKAKSAYAYVQQHFTHNGKFGFVPSQTLKDTWNNKTGSIADLNLLLLAILNERDIQAHPVLISTKGNGRAQLIPFPYALQFNELLIAADIDSTPVLLNVYDKQVPFGYLPLDNLVEEGFVVKSSDSQIIPLQTNYRSGIQQMVNISLNEGKVLFAHQIRFADFDAIDYTKRRAKQTEANWHALFNLHNADIVFDAEEKDISTKRQQLQTSFKLYRDYEESELLLVQPFPIARMTENPFTATERNFPVDFNFNFADSYTSILEIPDNYELDDFPEELIVALPDDIGSFMYRPVLIKNTLKINLVWQLNKTMIDAADYPALKSFMEQVTGKLKEPIILKAKL